MGVAGHEHLATRRRSTCGPVEGRRALLILVRACMCGAARSKVIVGSATERRALATLLRRIAAATGTSETVVEAAFTLVAEAFA